MNKKYRLIRLKGDRGITVYAVTEARPYAGIRYTRTGSKVEAQALKRALEQKESNQ